MEMIFPGMDPHLENPVAWPGFHSRFIVHLADELETRLGPRYATSVNERVYVEGASRRDILPDVHLTAERSQAKRIRSSTAVEDVAIELVVADVEVKEWYVEIIDQQTKGRVVTVIEVISPTNKKSGPDRESYLRKQREVLGSQTRLVELDFLRMGNHVAALPDHLLEDLEPFDYFASVNRAVGDRDRFRIYRFRLRDPLPMIFVPLAKGDPDVPMDVRAALATTYRKGHFRTRLPYDKPCKPRLSPSDQAWANNLIAAGMRRSSH